MSEHLYPPSYAEILRFVVPLILGLLTSAFHTLIDTFFISQLGSAQLAAIPLAAVAYFTGLALFAGILHNSIAFFGRAYGAHQDYSIGTILSTYQLIALFALPLLGLFIQIWPLYSAIANLNPTVDNYAWTYLQIRVWEVPFCALLILYSSFYEAFGNSRFPMLIAISTLLLNIVLDYGLIFGNFGMPALGVAGSAYATVLSQAFGALIIIISTFASNMRNQFHLRIFTWPHFELLKQILCIGLPQGLGNMIETLTWLGLFLIIGRLGETALAANNIGIQVVHLFLLPPIALGIASASYTSRFLGSEQPELAKIAIYRTLTLGTICMSLSGISLWFFGQSIASWFTDDETIIYQAGLMFKMMALYQIFDGINTILRSALNGAGDTLVPTLFLIICAIFIMFPMAILLSQWLEFGLIGAWLGVFAYLFILTLLIIYRYHSGKWQTIFKEIHLEENECFQKTS